MFRLSSRSLRAGLLLPVAALAVAVPGATAQPATHATSAAHQVTHPAARQAVAAPAAAVPQAPPLARASTGHPAVTRLGTVGPKVTPTLTLTALAWSQTHVDATSGTATDTLTWTITDSVPGDDANINGNVQIGRIPTSTTANTNPFIVGYAASPQGPTWLVRLTDTQATFSYTFPVNQYAPSSTQTWAVRSLTIVHNAVPLTAFPSTFTADEIADTTAPTLTSVQSTLPLPYEYGGIARTVGWQVTGTDTQSGIWFVHVVVRGPGGARLTSSGLVNLSTGTFDAVVDFPVNTTGVWTVGEVDLTDNAGNTATVTGLSQAPVTFTLNNVVDASNIAFDQTPVNDWTVAQTVNLTMAITDAAAPVTSASVLSGSGCTGGTPVTDKGTLTIPITVPVAALSCQLNGLVLVDAAGNVSAYGPSFTQAHLPDFVLDAGPAPQADDFAISPNPLRLGGRFHATPVLSMTVSSWDPGVTSVCAAVDGAHEDCVTGLPRLTSGMVEIPLHNMAQLPPNQYPLIIEVDDAAQNTTFYDSVHGPTITLTITGITTGPGILPISVYRPPSPPTLR